MNNEGLTFIAEWAEDKKNWQRWITVIFLPLIVNIFLNLVLLRVLSNGIIYDIMFFTLAPATVLIIIHDVAPKNNIKLSRGFAMMYMLFGVVLVFLLIINTIMEVTSFNWESLVRGSANFVVGLSFIKRVPKHST